MIDKKEKPRKVELVPYDPNWVTSFEEEEAKIKPILQDNCQGIHHIGSTSIPNIYAKPIVDILIVVNDLSLVDPLNPKFEALGYLCMGEYGIKGRRFFWKYPDNKTHNVHLFEQSNTEVTRHLAFRDYLRQHPKVAEAYSWVKRCLAQQFLTDIESYINGKESFIRAIDYRANSAKSDQLNAIDDISLVPYNPNWPKLAQAEINTIKHITDLPFIAIEHLGSTAIEGMSAKPILDIFIAVESVDEIARWTKPLLALGYVDWPDNPDKTHARFFKGMPPYGTHRTHHLHIMPMGDNFKRRVAFRDLLQHNEELRNDYLTLKQKLAKQYPNDREAYTDAKAEFIKNILGTG